MKGKPFALFGAILALLGLAGITSAAGPASQPDWPQWRGPNRDGVAPNSPKLLDAWPKGGPKLLWKSDPIPGGPSGRFAPDGGAGSPVVADGRVFLFSDHASKYVVTSKMLADWGWMDGVPDDLAKKIEEARLSRNSKLAGTALDKYIDDFLGTLEPDQAKKFGEHIRKRITLGGGRGGDTTAGWWGMATIVGAGATDKEFATYGEWENISYKGKSFRDHDLVNGHGDSGTGGNFIQATVLRQVTRTDTVYCLDAATGKQLWKQEFPGESSKEYGFYWFTGAAGTPAIVNGRCYVAGGSGLYCLSTKDGSVIWKNKTTFTHCSPLVADGKVYVTFAHLVDADKKKSWGELRAYDAETGKFLWANPKVGGDTEGSPALWTHDGKSYLIVAAGSSGGLLCIDGAAGELAWQEKSVDLGSGAYGGHATPVVRGDLVVSQTAAVYKITPQKAEILWKAASGDYGCSPIVVQNHLYMCGGYAPLRCVDMTTGTVAWKKNDGSRTFSPILADDKIFLFRDSGMGMIKASADKVEELGRFEPVSGLMGLASPAIAGGKLYLRLNDCVACYDLRAEAK